MKVDKINQAAPDLNKIKVYYYLKVANAIKSNILHTKIWWLGTSSFDAVRNTNAKRFNFILQWKFFLFLDISVSLLGKQLYTSLSGKKVLATDGWEE